MAAAYQAGVAELPPHSSGTGDPQSPHHAPCDSLLGLGLQPTEEEEQRAQRRAREQALQEQQSLRVPVIDGQGRAYGTGKRKCSVARVWIKCALQEKKEKEKKIGLHASSILPLSPYSGPSN